MFNKDLFMSHVNNETANDKMIKAGISVPFSNLSEAGIQVRFRGQPPEVPSITLTGSGKSYESGERPPGLAYQGSSGRTMERSEMTKLLKDLRKGFPGMELVKKPKSHEDPYAQHPQKEENPLSEDGLSDKIRIIIAGKRPEEMGSKVPGRGEKPTDHQRAGGMIRKGEDRRNREIIAREYLRAKMTDPDARRKDAIERLMRQKYDGPGELY